MNRKITASLMILAAVLATAGFIALGSIFNYPDVLDEPAGTVLDAFRDSQNAVSAWFLVLALAAGLLAPIAIGVRRLSSQSPRVCDRRTLRLVWSEQLWCVRQSSCSASVRTL